MSEENRGTHKLYEKDRIGEVQIADEVVAIIAGLAATEVEGVDSMAGNITNELVGKLGMKNLSKGVKVDVTENHVSVDPLWLQYPFCQRAGAGKGQCCHRKYDGAYSAGCEYPDCRREYGRKLTESLMRLGAQVRIRVCSTF